MLRVVHDENNKKIMNDMPITHDPTTFMFKECREIHMVKNNKRPAGYFDIPSGVAIIIGTFLVLNSDDYFTFKSESFKSNIKMINDCLKVPALII